MDPRKVFLLTVGAVVVLLGLAWVAGGPLEMAKRYAIDGDRGGYPVTFTADETYKVEDFSLRLRFSDFRVAKGILVPGTTTVGTTVVLVLGDGVWEVREPRKYKWTQVDRDSSGTPFAERFASMYLRIHPRFYEELIAGAKLTRIRDDQAFRQAEGIFRHKFWNSYHTNERALIPSADIGAIDIESVTYGRLQIHDAMGFGGLKWTAPEVRHWDYQGEPPSYMD